jgi:hypothetical protein
LYQQARGHEEVAVDISPLAVKTCMNRGVRKARVCSTTEIDYRLGFETIVMFGNNRRQATSLGLTARNVVLCRSA